MNKVKSLLNKIGLFVIYDDKSPYSYNPEDYQVVNDKDKAEAHKNFLKTLEEDEKNRLTILESKTSQLISQTGIIFSLLSLFVPIFIDKVTDLNFFVKLLLVGLLASSFCFYMLTIQNALKNFNVKNFNYSNPSPKNVLTLQDKGLDVFFAEEVRDLLYSINENLKINNKKATNLLHSYNSFKIANTSTGILVVIFSIFLLFFTPRKESLSIEKSVRIENYDSVINKLPNAISAKKDSMTEKIKDTFQNRHNP